MGERALLRDALETGWDSTADLRPRPCSRPLRPAHAGATSFSPSANLIVSRAPTEKKPVSPSGGTDRLPPGSQATKPGLQMPAFLAWRHLAPPASLAFSFSLVLSPPTPLLSL